MPTSERQLYEVISQTRRLFQVLGARTTELHRDLHVTVGQRALMEALDQQELRTVPQIARSKSVTRQHIQTLANELHEGGLIETLENPAHRRSPLLRLTAAGRARFAEMRSREAQLLSTMASALSAEDLAVTLRTLNRIEEQVAQAFPSEPS